MVSKKDKKEAREIAQEQAKGNQDAYEMSEESFDRDIETSRNPSYASDEIPTDMVKYKRMRLVPDSQAEFKGVLDKDVVLANVKNVRPDPAYLKLISETIVVFEENFKIPVTVYSINDKGQRIPILNKDGKIIGYETEVIMVFDEVLRIIPTFLRSSFKADLTLSRAMGDDREAILDRTQNFGKEIKKTDNKNKYIGGN